MQEIEKSVCFGTHRQHHANTLLKLPSHWLTDSAMLMHYESHLSIGLQYSHGMTEMLQ